MLFRVYHIQNKPLDLVERDLFVAEWREKSGKLLEVRPAQGDQVAWQAINDELDKLENSLREKYKCTDEWEVKSLEDMIEVIQNYGTVSLCLENDKPIIYLMDLPAQQKVEGEQA